MIHCGPVAAQWRRPGTRHTRDTPEAGTHAAHREGRIGTCLGAALRGGVQAHQVALLVALEVAPRLMVKSSEMSDMGTA